MQVLSLADMGLIEHRITPVKPGDINNPQTLRRRNTLGRSVIVDGSGVVPQVAAAVRTTQIKE